MTIVLRDHPLPRDYRSRKGLLLRWVAETLGLLGKKGDVVLDVLDGLFYYNVTKGYPPTLEELISYVNRKRRERGDAVVAAEAVRYHVRKMEDMGILERSARRGGKLLFRRYPYGSGRVSDFVLALKSDAEDIFNRLLMAIDALSSLYEV